MPNDNPISPQDSEAMVKRLFAVAKLLAKVKTGKQRDTTRKTKSRQKHESTNVLYLEEETNNNER